MKKIMITVIIAALALMTPCACAEPADIFESDAMSGYKALYEALEDGGSVRKGTRGSNAQALQTLLNEFGAGIDADGIAGTKTMEAFGETLKMLGCGESSAADAESALPLFKALAVREMGEAAREFAGDDFDELYTAVLIGEDSVEKAYLYALGRGMDALALLPEAPESGETARDEAFKGMDSIVEIRYEEGLEYGFVTVTLTAPDGTEAVKCVVKPGDTVKLPVPEGEYGILFAAGNTWFGNADGLGSGADRFAAAEALNVAAGKAYTVTVNAEGTGEGITYTAEE